MVLIETEGTGLRSLVGRLRSVGARLRRGSSWTGYYVTREGRLVLGQTGGLRSFCGKTTSPGGGL
jgi:hypothetical protein